jgi:hypothetical protein
MIKNIILSSLVSHVGIAQNMMQYFVNAFPLWMWAILAIISWSRMQNKLSDGLKEEAFFGG